MVGGVPTSMAKRLSPSGSEKVIFQQFFGVKRTDKKVFTWTVAAVVEEQEEFLLPIALSHT